jgi:xanthine dehydrogenase accessory factor
MNEWLTAQVSEPAVLVTVAIVEGSGPREPGAKMLVTARGQHDTIGGGHLECARRAGARAMPAPPGGAAMRGWSAMRLGPRWGSAAAAWCIWRLSW